MATIRVFNSHIEVYPYTKGDKPRIEKMVSKYDPVTHKYVPLCMHIENDILYLPRGLNLESLQREFNSELIVVKNTNIGHKIKKGVGKFPPKSTIQENSIKFLCGLDQYIYTRRYSQLGLNLDTGDGKTYASVYAILKLKMRAIIITHQEKLKQQWIKTFDEMTTFPIENLYNIKGTESIDEILKGETKPYDIYCVNHQTLSAYAREHGWSRIRELFDKINVGIKVVDESHKFFENTFLIDCFSNCYKTFYLTATFSRSDPHEIRVYKRAFASLTRFGEETIDYKEKRRHINFIVMYFSSKPEYGIIPNIRTNYGFSSYKYIDYELSESYNSLMKIVYNILDMTADMEGKILIISPKVETVDKIAKAVSEYTGKEVGTVYGKHTAKQNKEALSKDIISSTIKSVGEGVDIKGLRVLINLEPIGSKALADQVRGRLREYSEDKDTYFFYPVDTSLPELTTMLRRIMPVMKRKCKKIIYCGN